jgi:hypothetical protein
MVLNGMVKTISQDLREPDFTVLETPSETIVMVPTRMDHAIPKTPAVLFVTHYTGASLRIFTQRASGDAPVKIQKYQIPK